MDNMKIKERNNETDLLTGNMNRMCVTDDLKELESMYDFTKKKLEIIYKINKLKSWL